MTDFAAASALWRHMQAAHRFDGWDSADVLKAYEGESLEDIHKRDHTEPQTGVRHEHQIGAPLAPRSTMP